MPDFADCGEVVDEADRNRITGLAAIRAAYRHAKAHPDQKLIVTGHTDRSGSADYNLKLSQLRSDNVLAVLTGQRDEWIKICKGKHKVEDYQQILKWVHAIWDWNCDPGKVDNVLGSQTREATKRFQEHYNRGDPEMEDGFSAQIPENGIVGDETWGAFFDVYTRVLMYILEVDEEGLDQLQKSLKFVDDSKKSVGCGENHPITENRAENFRSKIDRRVEVLYFDPAELPRLDCHPAAGKCVPEKCEIFDDDMFDFDPIPCEPIPPPVRTWALRILQPGPAVIRSETDPSVDSPPAKRKPMANIPFELAGAGGPEPIIAGTTDADGLLRVRVVQDPAVMTLTLKTKGNPQLNLPNDIVIKLNAGTLPKIREGDDAVKHRLINLGYGKAKLADWDDVTFSSAVKKFQRQHGLTETGTADDATKAKLKEVHGS
jgi:peptidoglycan hydrolase-like protein with peptidoglycan-binding domain